MKAPKSNENLSEPIKKYEYGLDKYKLLKKKLQLTKHTFRTKHLGQFELKI